MVALFIPISNAPACRPSRSKTMDIASGCGKCATSCPMRNIEMVDGCPLWYNRCALCTRCYHICPYNAVQYGKATADKGQYLLK